MSVFIVKLGLELAGSDLADGERDRLFLKRLVRELGLNGQLTGAVRYLSLFVSTGKLEATGLEVMAAEANVTSSGVAALWVTDRFQGKTSTGGKITYKGAPPIVRSGAKFMGGDITRVE